mgnify:FL=1
MKVRLSKSFAIVLKRLEIDAYFLFRWLPGFPLQAEKLRNNELLIELVLFILCKKMFCVEVHICVDVINGWPLSTLTIYCPEFQNWNIRIIIIVTFIF